MDLGIDLGTTFSVLAVDGRVELAADYPAGLYLAECDVTIIPTHYGESTFPAALLDDPDQPGGYCYGTEALQAMQEGAAPVRFSKRRMGTREELPLRHGSLLAKEAARLMLGHLKQCAEQALGQTVHRAVVTHPAYFDRGAVEETRQAASEAGFDMSLPEQMLMEPVAAALTYTRTDPRDPLHVLVYDLGGGTFDVTYLRRSEQVIEALAFDGDPLLGGYNFDRQLAHWIRQQLEAQGREIRLDEARPEDRAALARLLALAERVKIDLSQERAAAAPVEIRARGILTDSAGRDVQLNSRITQAEFVALIQPDLDRTIESCHRVLHKAQASPDDVEEIVLVGGSTYGPWVLAAVAAAFPGRTPRRFQPDLCVAAGAAIHARMVLPAMVDEPRCRVALDIRDSYALDTIVVPGEVGLPGNREPTGLQVSLRLATGAGYGPLAVETDGAFLFDEVELCREQRNTLQLTVTDPAGGVLLEHAFEVAHTTEDTHTAGIAIPLPRSLYVRAREGLVLLAAEATPLPVRIEQTYERTNNLPSMNVELYQEQDPIGFIGVHGLPTDNAAGSLVHLRLEVTDKNVLRGTVTVEGPRGGVVHREEVEVRFEAPPIPPAEELRAQLAQHRARQAALARSAAARHQATASQALPLLAELDRLFAQQPLERQEVAAALRRLAHLLDPPDDLRPTREEYCQLLDDCRERMDAVAQHARATLVEADAVDSDSEFEQRRIALARAALEQDEQRRRTVDDLERTGLAAHADGDRRAWVEAYDALECLLAELAEGDLRELATPVLKQIATSEAMRTADELEQAMDRLRDQIGADPAQLQRLAEWEREAARLRAEVEAVMAACRQVDDALPPEQGLARLRGLLGRSLGPLREKVRAVGVDVQRQRRP